MGLSKFYSAIRIRQKYMTGDFVLVHVLTKNCSYADELAHQILEKQHSQKHGPYKIVAVQHNTIFIKGDRLDNNSASTGRLWLAKENGVTN